VRPLPVLIFSRNPISMRIPVFCSAPWPPRLPPSRCYGGAFFREPDVRSVQVSPDGHHLAFLTPWVPAVGIAMIDWIPAVSNRCPTSDENIAFYYWKAATTWSMGRHRGNESAALRGFDLLTRKAFRWPSLSRALCRPRQFRQRDRPAEFDPKHMLINAGAEWARIRSVVSA